MNAQPKQWKRLKQLKEAQERLRETELAAAQADVQTIVRRIREAEDDRQQALTHGRDSLISGAWSEWWMNQSIALIAEQQLGVLDQLREKCQSKADVAHERLCESRVEAEQLRMLAENARRLLFAEEERKRQVESDDRFAARQHWQSRQTVRGHAKETQI